MDVADRRRHAGRHVYRRLGRFQLANGLHLARRQPRADARARRLARHGSTRREHHLDPGCAGQLRRQRMAGLPPGGGGRRLAMLLQPMPAGRRRRRRAATFNAQRCRPGPPTSRGRCPLRGRRASRYAPFFALDAFGASDWRSGARGGGDSHGTHRSAGPGGPGHRRAERQDPSLGRRGLRSRLTVDAVLKRLAELAGQEQKHYEDVLASRLLSRDGDRYQIFMKLRRSKIITVTYNTEHDVRYRRLGAARAQRPQRGHAHRATGRRRDAAGARTEARLRQRLSVAAECLLALRSHRAAC